MSPPVSQEAAMGGTQTQYWANLASQANPKISIDPNKTQFLGPNFKEQPLWRRLNYLHVVLLTSTPLLALYGLASCEWYWQTFAWAVVYYFATGLGITAGYHRLFAHRAYHATPLMEWALVCMGSGAVEGSVKWWSRDHRAHHRYVDTPKDPYPATRGFWHSHLGWMLIKQDKDNIGRVDITDLTKRWIVNFQHKYYGLFALMFGFIVPMLVAGFLWGDWKGGFFIAGVGRLVFVHHSTFCVNSLAHWAGDSTYTDGHTAKNSIVTAFATIGEGYHNFHHEFPSDYRNGVEWYQYDPTKWFIRTLSWLGLTYDLKRFPMNEIKKGKLQMEAKHLKESANRIYWGPDTDTLPTYTQAEIDKHVKEGKKWVLLDGFVIDVEQFMTEHPGGEKIIALELGKDISQKFRGEVYKHSNAAHNYAQVLRIGRVVDSKKNA